MTKNQVHEWHETRPEGGKHYFRAHFDGKRWNFAHTTPEDIDWPVIDEPDLELWEALHDVLFRKYQRNRLNYRLIESVNSILTRVRAGEVAQPAPKAEPQNDLKRGRFPQRRRGGR